MKILHKNTHYELQITQLGKQIIVKTLKDLKNGNDIYSNRINNNILGINLHLFKQKI